MAKTNPIGVRFDKELLEKLETAGLAKSPQKALNLYERSYLELIALKVKVNNQPENKARIESERNPVTTRTNSGMVVDFKGAIPPSAEAKVILDEISRLEKELKNPPQFMSISMNMYRKVREDNIKDLKTKLASIQEQIDGLKK